MFHLVIYASVATGSFGLAWWISYTVARLLCEKKSVPKRRIICCHLGEDSGSTVESKRFGGKGCPLSLYCCRHQNHPGPVTLAWCQECPDYIQVDLSRLTATH